MKLKKISIKATNSTNDIAIKKIKKGIKSGIVVAEIQKKGRGRYGRKWISIQGNLFTTIFFEIKKNCSLKEITNQNCNLVKKSLQKLVKYKISVKPPNDLLIKGKKFCGILQETIIHDCRKFIIIGIGININNDPNIKCYPTTNLNEFVKKRINKDMVFANIRKIFEKNDKLTIN